MTNMDVFQTDWKEKHESRGTREPPTLLNVWHGYLGEEDESTVLERINVPTIFHPDQELYHVNRDLERRAEVRSPRETKRGSMGSAGVTNEEDEEEGGAGKEASSSGACEAGDGDAGDAKEEAAKIAAANASRNGASTSGSMFGSVFSVFSRKEEPVENIVVKTEVAPLTEAPESPPPPKALPPPKTPPPPKSSPPPKSPSPPNSQPPPLKSPPQPKFTPPPESQSPVVSPAPQESPQPTPVDTVPSTTSPACEPDQSRETIERGCLENGKDMTVHEMERVIVEFDLRHPTIEEGQESMENGVYYDDSCEDTFPPHHNNVLSPGGTIVKQNKECTSDEASSSALSTDPSTSSRHRNKGLGMFGRLALFMKGPKRKRLRKGSLDVEGTSGESSTSNSAYNYDNNTRPSLHSSMSVGTGSNNVQSGILTSEASTSIPRENSLPERSQSVPVNKYNNHAPIKNDSPIKNVPPRKSHPKSGTLIKNSDPEKMRQTKISEPLKSREGKRKSRELPTEDFVLSDPEPEPSITTPRFAPYRTTGPPDDSSCTPLPCTPLTNKNRKSKSSKNKQPSKLKQTVSSKDSDSSRYSSRRSSATSKSKKRTRNHQKYGVKNNRHPKSNSKGRTYYRRDDILRTPTNVCEKNVYERSAEGVVQPSLGRMLDNRGRCGMYPPSSATPGTNMFDFLTWDDDSDSVLSEECFSLATSGRGDTSSSEGSMTSLPSLATFNSFHVPPPLPSPATFKNTPAPRPPPSLPSHGSHSADIFRNHVKPIGREGWERSRSMSDIRCPNSLSSAVANFAVVRSPTRLTPPPPRRNQRVGDIFCLPSCFTPVNFDRAMLLE